MKVTVIAGILSAGSNGEAMRAIARAAMAEAMVRRLVMVDSVVGMKATGKVRSGAIAMAHSRAMKAMDAACKAITPKVVMAGECKAAMDHREASVEAMAVTMKEAPNGAEAMSRREVMAHKPAMEVSAEAMKVMDAARDKARNGAVVTVLKAVMAGECRAATVRRVSADMKATKKEEAATARVVVCRAGMVPGAMEDMGWKAAMEAASVAGTKDTARSKARSTEGMEHRAAITGTRTSLGAATRDVRQGEMRITDQATGITRTTGTAGEAGDKIIIIRGRMIFSLFY